MEQREIYSRLKLWIPKSLWAYIRVNTILSVAIPQTDGGDYVGNGVIKNVRIQKGDAYLECTLQIAIDDPLNHREE